MNLLKILFSSFSLIYALKLNPTIKKTAKYSAQAYNKEFNKLNSKLITKFDDNIGICAYEDKKDLILTIRGTCNFEDWKVNLNCFLVEHPHISTGSVHRGYLNKSRGDALFLTDQYFTFGCEAKLLLKQKSQFISLHSK